MMETEPAKERHGREGERERKKEREREREREREFDSLGLFSVVTSPNLIVITWQDTIDMFT